MASARIEHAGYVGWRGMTGCEVIDFDGELTGFIGGGGAGKSTLIMALDYALLPDRRAMNIRSVSDLEDAHSSGIDPMLGRIDESYGYAYVVLDITTRHDKRFIAGVYVEPEDGSAVLKGWLIRHPPGREVGLEALMRCQDGEDIYYPDLTTLKRELAAKGIDLTVCKVLGDYGQALYDAGILPGPMNSPNDRALFGNLLGTTFRGGISKDVAIRLKDYLLPAQTHVQDLVLGLKECTNEVLRTRHAVADADRQLALLESTYGIGKEAVLTAIQCIADGVATSESQLRQLRSDLANKTKTSQSLEESIPVLIKEIAVMEETKHNKLAAALLRSQELEQDKNTAYQQVIELKTAMDAAATKLKRFNNGGTIWKKIIPHHTQEDSLDDAVKWFDAELRKIGGEIFLIESEIKALRQEDDRLSEERASAASEHLAEKLGGQSLEQALGHVSEREAVGLEMSMGGLVDGVVGVGISALADLEPGPDLPKMFWLGEAAPTARIPKETGRWYVTATSGGYIVASKERASVFGRDARQQRRATIATELIRKSEEHTKKNVQFDTVNADKTLLLKNSDEVCYFLEYRTDVFAIDKEARDTKRAHEEGRQAYDEAAREHSEIQQRMLKIQAPYEAEIAQLRQRQSSAERDQAALHTVIEEQRRRISDEEARHTAYRTEFMVAQEILGSEFDRFLTASTNLPSPAINTSAQQTQRIAMLTRSVGDDAERLASFHEVDVDQRVSVIRLWPDLMTIVRESVNVELADSDGGDLIQAMRVQRSKLDTDLKGHEQQLGIKAKNIFMTINGNVRSQTQKIAKLSKLGQTIAFGNVTGIQIRLVQRPRMLELLQQFADLFGDQRGLFAQEKPIDQLLKEFFDASVTGGVKLTGEQLLDYRNYVDLVIEVRRSVSDKWELAAFLSGTEAIGGGLAIALILVRSIASRAELAGSGIKVHEICPLFAVDEVGRLNADGQGLLVDFARRENFQLVVTAPTIKPTYNCTLYSLTRKCDPHEQLIIRGIKHRNAPLGHPA